MGITQPPSDAIGFTVIVSPAALHLPCWRFVVLLSKEDSSQADKILPEICQAILDPGDQFSIYNYGIDDEDSSLEGVGVMSYFPDAPDVFDWITVPSHMRH